MSRFMNAQEVIDCIEQRKNRGHGLDHFKNYMASIGNPQQQLSCIHVAGTNGKGSTVNDLRSILQEAGYRVGTFTSPYMITHLDRIRINDQYMDEYEFLTLANEAYDSWITWDLSMFEIDMMLACVYFVKHKVDVCVFEVGLGGRLDATNILTPRICAITNIGMDHMELLGDTYEKIAEEKAGIIKEKADVVTAETREECLRVFARHAKECHVSLRQVANIEVLPKQDGAVFRYRGRIIELASQADYQIRNAALAMEVILQLRANGLIQASDEQIKEGLHKAVWIGRFEIMQKEPLVILDGAHNPDGIQALCDSLKDQTDIAVLFSVLKDKNFEAMLDILETITQDITITHFENDRALDLEMCRKRPHLTVVPDDREALRGLMKTHKTIVITGSLYFISEMRKLWKH